MKYETPSAFLMALKSNARRQAHELGVSPQRVQKEIIFERLMVRLLVVAPGRWVLKGGVALDFRYIPQARATRDLDLAWLGSEEEATRDLRIAQTVDLGDYFTFFIERRPVAERAGVTAASYRASVEIAGHHYASVVVDVGLGDPLVESADQVVAPGFLRFAGIEPATVPVLALPFHIAEKVHAYSRQYASGPSSRPKDLIDLVVISSHASITAGPLRHALEETFRTRGTHTLPTLLPEPPEEWSVAYTTLAREIGAPLVLREGYERASDFVTPVLGGMQPGHYAWDPKLRRWQG